MGGSRHSLVDPQGLQRGHRDTGPAACGQGSPGASEWASPQVPMGAEQVWGCWRGVTGDTYTVHVQGVAALLTASPSGPRRGIVAVEVDHGWGTDWRGRGHSGDPDATYQARLRDVSPDGRI